MYLRLEEASVEAKATAHLLHLKNNSVILIFKVFGIGNYFCSE
jgi:hypothetical protein